MGMVMSGDDVIVRGVEGVEGYSPGRYLLLESLAHSLKSRSCCVHWPGVNALH